MKRLFAWILALVLFIGCIPVLPVHAEDAEQPGTEETIILPEETEPEVTEPVVTEPEVTEPSAPETTDPAEPEVTEPSVPETTDPTEPDVTEPTEPEVTAPTEPETTEPTEPQDGEESNQDDTAAEEIPEGLKYVVGEDGVTITDYTGRAKELIIPSEIEGKPVTVIGEYAFEHRSDLERIVLPESLHTIQQYAFYSTNLSEINIPNSVKIIEDCAFYYNYDLESITLSDSITKIGAGAFKQTGITSIKIPTSVNIISEKMFYGCSKLKTVELHDNISVIESEAFAYCKGLTEFVIPDSVETFGDNIFYYCEKLTNVVFPAHQESIPNGIFMECRELSSFTISDSVTKIGDHAFDSCWKLTNITIPSTVTTIGAYAFDGCFGITEFNIPSTVTYIGDYAFSGCGGLESIVFPENVAYLGAGVVKGCTKLSSVTIPENIHEISAYMFSGCKSLTEVVFHDNVTAIGGHAFYRCESLIELVLPNSVATIGNGAFMECTKLESIDLPDQLTTISSSMFSGCNSLVEFVVPDSVVTIESYAFSDCTKLKSIKLPDGLKVISYAMFQGCKSLKISLPSSLTTIEGSAFSECSGLTSIAIPEGVTSIGNQSFAHCNFLTRVYLPASLKTIGSAAFYEDEYIWHFFFAGSEEQWKEVVIEGTNHPFTKTPVHYNSSAKDVVTDNTTTCTTKASHRCKICDARLYILSYKGGHTFENGKCSVCDVPETGLTYHITYQGMAIDRIRIPGSRLEIPSELEGIPVGVLSAGVLRDSTALEEVVIPSSVKEIGGNAFHGCSNLKSVSLSPGLKRVYAAFSNCTSLKNISFPDSVEYIGSNVFQGCTALESVSLPDKLSEIGNYAFDKCVNLASITIPDGVTSIGSHAFRDCSKLSDVKMPENLTQIGYEAFLNCKGLSEIYISKSVTKIDGYAFKNCDNLDTIHTSDMDALLKVRWDIGAHPFAYPSPSSGKYVHNRYYENGKLVTEALMAADQGYMTQFAFTNCRDLKRITIPERMDDIGDYQFLNCTSLTHVSIPKEITSISENAFKNCRNLKCITFGGTAEELEDITIWAEGNSILSKVGWHVNGSCCRPTFTVSQNIHGFPLIKWKSVRCAVAYGIYHSVDNENYYLIDIVDGNEYIDLDAVPGEKNYYAVVGISTYGGTGGTTGFKSVLAKCEAPVISVSRDDVSGKPVVSWESVSSAKKYQVYRATSQNGKYSSVKTVTGTSYTDTTAKPGTTYYYRVHAIGTSSTTKSIASNVVSMLTICAQPVVKATVNSTTGQPSLSWKKVTGANKYEVYRATEAAGEYQLLATQKAVTFLDTTAAGDTQYYYKVKAISTKAGANSTDMTPVAICSAMAQPVITVGNTAEGAPKITWDAVSNAVSYRVIRSTSQKGTYTEVGTTTETAFVDVTAQTGALYYYKVMAVGKVSESVPSAYKSTRACCESPVIGSDVQASTGKPMISWNAVEGARKYEVYRAASENGKYKKIKTVTALVYTDTTAKPGTTYYYKVMAVPASSAAKSIASNIVGIKCICAQPVVKATVNSTTGQPNLSWKKITGASKYNIYRATAENGDFELLSTQKGVSFKDLTAAADTVYYYRVDVVPTKAGADSIPADPIKVISGLAKPVIKATVDEQTGKPVITWNEVSGANQYRIVRSTKKSSGYVEVGVTSELRFVDTTAVAGKTYYYKVIAIGENAESTLSSYKKLRSR